MYSKDLLTYYVSSHVFYDGKILITPKVGVPVYIESGSEKDREWIRQHARTRQQHMARQVKETGR